MRLVIVLLVEVVVVAAAVVVVVISSDSTTTTATTIGGWATPWARVHKSLFGAAFLDKVGYKINVQGLTLISSFGPLSDYLSLRMPTDPPK